MRQETAEMLDDAKVVSWVNPSSPGGSFGLMPKNSVPPFIDKLPAGAYQFGIGLAGPFARPVDLKQDDLILFEDEVIQDLMKEIQSFWDARQDYADLGCHYKRGIVLYGPPGTGKSGILRILAHKLIEEGGIVAICNGRVEPWQECLPYFSRAESPDRRVMVLIEDFECAVACDEHEMLQLLDGVGDGRDGILYIGTTNAITEIPARIMRPSRFDKLVEVNQLSEVVRRQYIEHMATKTDKLYPELVENMVEVSTNLTMAQVKEMVIACVMYGYAPIEVCAKFEEIRKICLDDGIHD